jgi:hypothetical protein
MKVFSKMSFPKDIKKALKECILTIIWPREDIAAFFKKCGCNKKDLNAIIKHKSFARAKIIYLMFAHLDAKKDEGYDIYKAMNNSLLIWKNFDPYYFDKINKLNREDAEEAINKLKELQYQFED